MSSIGGISVDLWKGYLYTGVQPTVTLFAQGGVPGSGVVFGAAKAEPKTIITMTRVVNHAGFLSAQAAYLALVTTAITVVDQFGESWADTLVMAVDSFESDDPLGTIITAKWTLLLASS